jgi:hypothetical protein
VPEIIAAAQERNVDFLMLTDHSTLEAKEQEGWHGNVLLVVGQEISPRFNHYIAFGIDKPVFTEVDEESNETPQRYIDMVMDEGGIGFLAHPDHEGTRMFHVKHFPWVDREVSGYTGISIWDFMTDWQSSLDRFPGMIINYFFPAHVLRGPKRTTLEWWDRLNQKKRVVGIGELDNHCTIFKIMGVPLRIFPFQKAFTFIRTHILLETSFSGNDKADIGTLLEALSTGRAYVALEYFSLAKGFEFFIFDRDNSATMGDVFEIKEKAVMSVRTPRKALIRLIRNGRVFGEKMACEVTGDVSEGGVYRAEAYLKSWGRFRPWIFSNPIHVQCQERKS